MNKRVAIVPIVLIVAGCLYGWYVYSGNADAGSSEIEGSGTIEAVELNLGSQIAGELRMLRVEEGKRVKKDDTIAMLDESVLKDQLLSAEAGVEAAKAAVDDADTTAGKNVAKAQLKQAEAAFSIAQTQFTYAIIKSPIDGVVLSLPYKEGEVVNAGATIAVIGKTSELDLTIYVDEKELAKVKTGQSADIGVDAYPGEVFNGHIVEIASDAEFTPQNVQTKEQRSNLVFAVKIRIDNARGKLKAGMVADVTLSAGDK
ncbi:MAG: efflux RND transporter periplasmic adaptor subunit [Rubrobacteridae bacterium]|nr:efflux RND transporter periplasmic adaptor subunit [Rubrobacteridae bacterium]